MKPAFTLLLATLLLFSFQTGAQTLNIPDQNFLNALVNTTCADLDGDGAFETDADINNDGNIQVNEAQSVLGLSVFARQISSLEGIQQFTNLRRLDCSANFLAELPVANLTTLTYLECSLNHLTELDVHDLIHLQSLLCSINPLEVLDVQNLTELEFLSCAECSISVLEVQNLQKLKELDCFSNQLTALEVQGLDSLTVLVCSSNQLPSLNLQGLNRLTALNCGLNLLDTLDLHGLPNLQLLGCALNNLTSLDVQLLPGLKQLYCAHNELTELNLYGLAQLERVECLSNNLTTLDLRSSPHLIYLSCENNQLATLYIKNGEDAPWITPGFAGNPLLYLCCNEPQIEFMEILLENAEITNCLVNSYCDFISGGASNALTGSAIVDVESDGCDSLDSHYPHLTFQIEQDGAGPGIFTTTTSGTYFLPLGSGIYRIVPENPLHFEVSPDTLFLDLSTTPDTILQDFCVTPAGIYHDVETGIVPVTPARPGFESTYLIYCKNNGTQPQSGHVTLVFSDNLMDFMQATPPPAWQTTDTLRWDFTDLPPFGQITFEVEFLLNTPTQQPPVHIGDELQFRALAQISETDELPRDNVFELLQTTVGSYDPNDKTCLEGDHISPEMAGDYLHYLIRFENTGTFAAENVVVRDSIDTSNFDPASLRLVESSHDCYVRINGNLVEFIFENIQLPFTEPGKHGFVLFKVKTRPELPLGTVLTNKANIYFDFNQPVVTNVATTTVSETIATYSPIKHPMNLRLRPNPAQDMLFLQTDQPVERVEISDALGRIVLSTGVQNGQIDIAHLPQGVYRVKVFSGNLIATKQVVKQ